MIGTVPNLQGCAPPEAVYGMEYVPRRFFFMKRFSRPWSRPGVFR